MSKIIQVDREGLLNLQRIRASHDDVRDEILTIRHLSSPWIWSFWIQCAIILSIAWYLKHDESVVLVSLTCGFIASSLIGFRHYHKAYTKVLAFESTLTRLCKFLDMDFAEFNSTSDENIKERVEIKLLGVATMILRAEEDVKRVTGGGSPLFVGFDDENDPFSLKSRLDAAFILCRRFNLFDGDKTPFFEKAKAALAQVA